MKYYTINQLMFDNYIYLLRYFKHLMETNKIEYNQEVYQATITIIKELKEIKNK